MVGYVNFFSSTQYGDFMSWALIFLGVIIGAKIVSWIIEKFVKNLTQKTKTTLDDKILEAFENSLVVIAAIIICYLAAYDLPLLVKNGELVGRILFTITVFGAGHVLLQFIRAVLGWYSEEVAHKTSSEFDDIFIPILQKTAFVFVYVIALLIVLAKMGVSIAPILAGLGVAGIAIGLALKDTLAELFAGFYIMADNSIKKGDLVRLDNGEEGFIADIGWRTSKIKTYPNNFIIVPNTRLANSLIQNFEVPMKHTSFLVKGGVSYETDLDKAENILMNVAKEVLSSTEGADKKYQPIVRFTHFGDSNIDFTVILQSKSYPERHPIIHEFIKNTKKEFDKAGIEINYPARKIYYAKRRR